MFGKIRASSSSLESLERPPSKIPKDDSLSIYESTLVRLEQGSRRKLSPPSKQTGSIDAGSVLSSTCIEPMMIDVSSSSTSTSQDSPEFTSSLNEEVMSIDTDCHLSTTHSSSSNTLLASSPKEQDKRTVSILYLFSKFKSAHHAVSLASEHGCSVGISSSFSSCHSLDSTKQRSEQEFVIS